jgi:FtsP/CotA-like multicopper oxidase with cupredoxin domain
MTRKIAFSFIVMFLVGSLTLSVNIRSAKASTVRNITLYGSFSGGWGFTPGGETIPGPTITVDQGDLVNLTLIREDLNPHEFYVDYNANHVPDDSEPIQSFSGTVHFSFTANINGTFTYYCAIHQATMHGTFTVNPAIPEFSSFLILPALIIALLVVIVNRKRTAKTERPPT